MRVAIVSPEFPPDIGGVETYALEFVRELASRGHEVTVFTLRHPQGEASLPGVRIDPALRTCISIDRTTLARHDADVWHALNAAYAWVAAERPNGIVSVHGNDFLRPYYPVAQPDLRGFIGARFWANGFSRRLRPLFKRQTSRLVKASLARAPHIIANSRYTESALVKQVPGCRGRTSVGYVGVAAGFFDVQPRPADDSVPRLLTVARLSEARKNVDQVLRALALLKGRHDFRYTIVGDGYDRPRLEALAKELQLEARVRFAGFVSQDELLDTYAQSDLMILTSAVIPGSHEGFGIAYLEAAASGVPSLAARLGGAAEAVEEGRSGFFVETPAVDALASALGRFLGGEIRFEQEACREFARRFLWKNVVDHALEYYPTKPS